MTEPTFYDLYLRVDDEQLYPVPIRLANLRVNGRRVNDNGDSITSQQNDQLVRRLFTVDAASGLAKGESVPSAVRYLTSATLTTTIILYTPTNISPPLLELEYGAIALDGGTEDAEDAAAALGDAHLPSRFVAKYTRPLSTPRPLTTPHPLTTTHPFIMPHTLAIHTPSSYCTPSQCDSPAAGTRWSSTRRCA